MDIKAICERKVAAQQALQYMQMTNVAGRTPEELAEIEIASAKAQIEYGQAIAAYQAYIDSEVNKVA